MERPKCEEGIGSRAHARVRVLTVQKPITSQSRPKNWPSIFNYLLFIR